MLLIVVNWSSLSNRHSLKLLMKEICALCLEFQNVRSKLDIPTFCNVSTCRNEALFWSVRFEAFLALTFFQGGFIWGWRAGAPVDLSHRFTYSLFRDEQIQHPSNRSSGEIRKFAEVVSF